MKNTRNAVLMLALALVCWASPGTAQGQVYVNVRPVLPHYERVVAPSPRHVWIDEEWEPRGGGYAFVGGHWALPPGDGMESGYPRSHWRQSPRGWVWSSGPLETLALTKRKNFEKETCITCAGFFLVFCMPLPFEEKINALVVGQYGPRIS